MAKSILGVHHVTAIASDPDPNLRHALAQLAPIALVNCDPYVPEWISRQQSGK
jgi:hypothetical protein